MKNQKFIVLIVGLLLIGGAGGVLARLSRHQNLGMPGVKTRLTIDPVKLDILLPETVLGCSSSDIPMDKSMSDYLPKDTSYAQRVYKAQDGFEDIMTVVLMGSDRTSIHKPERCLPGQGWNVDDARTAVTTVAVTRPKPYELPVRKLIASKTLKVSGGSADARGIYVYWFVNDKQIQTEHGSRMWDDAKKTLLTGVTPRWAYVSHFVVCRPGQEEMAFERIKQFIAASTPEFQLYPGQNTSEVPEAIRKD